jgi:peptidoglycan/xylan/chitin deacetylase (PgdA/CDA1 family)
MPLLMNLLESEGVPATFFVTGAAAERYPEAVRELVAAGHELGCHGWSHRAFTALTDDEAEEEIRASAALLRRSASVTAFRAPFLRLPERHLPLLVRNGFQVDASLGKYKPAHWAEGRRAWAGRAARPGPDRPGPDRPGEDRPPPLPRLAASVTSSFLRAPAWIRDPVLRRLSAPVVLFVHPWELVDLRDSDLRWDCRVGTGPGVVEALREVIALFRERGATFRRVTDAAAEASGRANADGAGP